LAHEDKNRFLEIITNEIERMTRLIDQVLDLERFDSGKQQLNFELHEIKGLLLEVTESMEQVFKEKNIAFYTDFGFENIELLVDSDRIKQVLLNLLSNASKFAKTRVELKGEISQHEMLIQVIDDGKGIESRGITLYI
jgi:signal transduction histidine kinase